MKKFVCSVAFAAAAVAAGASAQAKDAATAPHAVSFPKDYRDWTHVKSMVIFDKQHPLFDAFGGIHHVYANDKATKALKAKKGEFPTGSAFAFDLLAIDSASGAYTEGARKFVAVMVRDAKKFADTEGWAWEVFEGGNPDKRGLPDRASQKACATCHTEVGSRSFVFTEWRD